MGTDTTASASGAHSKSSYRLEIDGLRGLAVVAVIINHLNKTIMPSGYLGVDIFFVISGFVITSSLEGRQSKNFQDFITGFYTRRLKRLVPALVLFVSITSVLICLVNPNPNVSLTTGITSLFGLSNLYLLNQATDYFAASTELNAFTHTWSLGVEEQFYFLFPFLAWLTGFSRQTTKGARNLFWVTLSLSVVSLIGFIYFYKTNQPAAYFLMPTRIWELGAGCLLFLGLKHSNRFVHGLTNSPPLVITAAMIAVMFVPLQFAVSATMAIVLLTMALIACLRSGTAAFKLFTQSQVVYIGLISYSLYLWHWGILSLSRWTIGIHGWSIPWQLALMLLLAILSYRYLETPLRRSNWAALRWQSICYSVGASISTAIALLGLLWLNSINNPLLLRGINDIPSPPHFLPLKVSAAPFNPTCVVDNQTRPLREQTFQECTVPPKRSQGQTIWALGDSHIGHLQGLLYALHDNLGLGVHLIETPGTPFPMTQKKWLQEREIIFDNIKENLMPDDIVLVSRLFIERNQGSQAMQDIPTWTDEVVILSDYLASRGVSLVVAGPPPIFQVEGIDLCRSSLWSEFRPDCAIERQEISNTIDIVYNALEATAQTRQNIYIFNQFDLLCPLDEDNCSVFKDGILAYRDKDHLNTYGAASLTNPFINFLTDHKLLKP